MKPPDKALILGFDYQVDIVDEARFTDGAEAAGYCDREKQLIYINASQTNQAVADTLIHECIHAISAALNLDLEEKDVIRWTTSVRNLFRSNPDAIVWLAEKMSGRRYRSK